MNQDQNPNRDQLLDEIITDTRNRSKKIILISILITILLGVAGYFFFFHSPEGEVRKEAIKIMQEVSTWICEATSPKSEILRENFLGILGSIDNNDGSTALNVSMATRFGEYVVAPAHVLGNELNTIRLINNYGEIERYELETIYIDEEWDLALLRIPEFAGKKDAPYVLSQQELKDLKGTSSCIYRANRNSRRLPHFYLEYLSGIRSFPYDAPGWKEQIAIATERIKQKNMYKMFFESSQYPLHGLEYLIIVEHSTNTQLPGVSGSPFVYIEPKTESELYEYGLMGMVISRIYWDDYKFSVGYRFYHIIERIKEKTGIDLSNL